MIRERFFCAYFIIYYLLLLYSLSNCLKLLYGIPKNEAISDFVEHNLVATFKHASLHIIGSVCHIGKLYSFPFIILELCSSLIAISSSNFNSDTVFKKDSFIRPSERSSEIYELFLLFIVDIPHPMWYNDSVYSCVCFIN